MIEPKDKIYAQRLRYLRIQNDLKQNVVAQMLNLNSQQAYSKLERGQRHFTEKIIEKICMIFNQKKAFFTSEIEKHDDSNLFQYNHSRIEELEMLKTIIALKSEVLESQKIMILLSNKIRLEKEIELIGLQIKSLSDAKYTNSSQNSVIQ